MPDGNANQTSRRIPFLFLNWKRKSKRNWKLPVEQKASKKDTQAEEKINQSLLLKRAQTNDICNSPYIRRRSQRKKDMNKNKDDVHSIEIE